MKEPILHEIDYRVGQIWYVKEKGENNEYHYYPVRIIAIYPYILLTENSEGTKQAFTKACAFLELFTAGDVEKKRRAAT